LRLEIAPVEALHELKDNKKHNHLLEGLTKLLGGLKIRVSAGAQQMRKKIPAQCFCDCLCGANIIAA